LRHPAISWFESIPLWSSQPDGGNDPAGLSPRALIAILRSAYRELWYGLREVADEVHHWRRAALAIPDRPLREDALGALDRKRANIDGAALFWTLPRRRCPELLHLLVAFEVLADYLDCVSERSPDTHNGLQLHRSLHEALDPALTVSDYYRHNTWRDDGGYVRALVERCRQAVRLLPSYEQVRPLATRAAQLAQVLALNHDPDPVRRDAALAAWAAANFPPGGQLVWFELAAGASAWLTVLALLAYAADPGGSAHTAEAISEAYLWVSLAGTMLDSYGDVGEDEQAGAHSYIAHYPPDHASARVGEILHHATLEASHLPHGERHVAVASCMAAMYLSKDSTRTPASIDTTRELARCAGALPRLLIPVLCGWRIAYGQTFDRAPQPPTPTRRRLPTSAPLPAPLQTLAFWYSPHDYLAWCRRRCGPTFTVRAVGMAPLVFFSKSEDIKSIVSAPAEALHPGAGASVIAPLVGEGSFMLAEEDAHLAGRRKVLPALAHREVQQHTEMINDTARREIATWPRDRPVTLHPYLRALSLRVILQTIFGSNKNIGELHRLLLGMLSVTASLALQEQQLRALPPWQGVWQHFLSQRTLVNELLDRLILEEAHVPARESGLLAMMLSGQHTEHTEHADRVQIREDLMSVILAGHETTASELAWALQLLAHNPSVTARLADSIAADEASYLQATVYEVLRHRPVFLFTIPRVCNREHELGGRTYLPPEQLVGCVHLMHHDPDLYENPDRFQPERFLAAEPPSAMWMPWGGGRKRCPGHHLATLEMQLVLRAVVRAVQVLPVEAKMERARWRSVIVTPGRGCRVILRPRRATLPRIVASALFLTCGR
jgi:tetraprenyl-beta-curcumene synthase